MDVDVLLWGGTHRFEAYEVEGKFFVNPGSATGAGGWGWGGEGEEVVPSFCLMDVSLLALWGSGRWDGDGGVHADERCCGRCKGMCWCCMCTS